MRWAVLLPIAALLCVIWTHISLLQAAMMHEVLLALIAPKALIVPKAPIAAKVANALYAL